MRNTTENVSKRRFRISQSDFPILNELIEHNRWNVLRLRELVIIYFLSNYLV